MELYVIRHGETDYNKKGLFQGQIDIPLNDIGKKQAIKVAEKFETLNVDIIISSPLTRAIQTAIPIANMKNLSIVIDEFFIERNFGEMEGKKPTDELNIEVFSDINLNYKGKSIENILDFKERIYNGIEKIKKQYKDKNILLVTHTGVIEMITTYFLGMPEDGRLVSLGIENCGIRKFSYTIK